MQHPAREDATRVLAGAVGTRWRMRFSEITVAQPVVREVVQTGNACANYCSMWVLVIG